MSEPVHPKVFISYSHDSPAHMDRVLALANRLRDDGVDCVLDQYERAPAEGWPRWMEHQLDRADFVLLVCTEIYYRRVVGEERPGVGHGVCWESHLVYDRLYQDAARNERFIPVLLGSGDLAHIPAPLRSFTYYRVDAEEGYEDLYRHLTNQPRVLKPELGQLRRLPPRERRQDFFTRYWNVPHERNRFFTGREDILDGLRAALSQGGAAALTQAISGLGGVGKTQAAIEYAYLYHHDHNEYETVFWSNARAYSTLIASFLEIARMLDPHQQDIQDPDDAVRAVRRWLEGNDGWLLVFDSADQPELLREFRPRNARGHILLTSRAQVFDELGIGRPIEINEMAPVEALKFLFKRTGRSDDDRDEHAAAEQIASELGYLPLALEQAGAYIMQIQARFQDYLVSYRFRRLELLNRARPKAGDYPESVATTWSLNFREIEQASPVAADLLRLSAFLSPDAIPIELICLGASELGPTLAGALVGCKDDPLVLNEVLEPLTRYSLIRRDREAQTYNIHRLVQEVLKDGMDEETRRAWAERVIRALNKVFPDPKYENWSLCQRLLPHARVAAELVEQWGFEFVEAWRLLNDAGFYLREHAKYTEGEPFLQRELMIYDQVLESEHPQVASVLSNLAMFYYHQGKHAKAEQLYLRALAIREKVLGLEHYDLADVLNNLAALYYLQGKYAEAEPLLQRVLVSLEQTLGPEHLRVATTLNNLAQLYCAQGKFAEAEPVQERSLHIFEKRYGAKHPHVATTLNNLASLYSSQKKYSEAEPLYLRALAIREGVLGPEHPDVAPVLNSLAELYYHQGKYAEAEPLFQRVLVSLEQRLGSEHLHVGTTLDNLAKLYYHQGRYAEAEPLLERSLRIFEKRYGAEHAHVATMLNNLASNYSNQNKYAKAERLYLRALAIREKVLGPEHPDLAITLNNLAVVYQKQRKYAEAEQLYLRALAIRTQVPGAAISDVINNLAALYQDQGKYSEAKELYEQALALTEQLLDTEHSHVATIHNNLASLYRLESLYLDRAKVHQEQREYDKAELLFKEALAIAEKTRGPEHPGVALVLELYAGLLRTMGRGGEAAPLEERAKTIRAREVEPAA